MNDRELAKLYRALELPRQPKRRVPVIPCPICHRPGGRWCVRPEGHEGPYAHRERILKNADYLRSLRKLPGHYGAKEGG